ncbi:MAG: HAD-IA family hydrolase [Armatimonadetes bacterium]|nr:HAD-IA family hydrolase [Armatimonadota bacterium]
MMASIRAVLFDAYGTLVRLDSPFERMQAALARRGIFLPLESVSQALQAEMRYYRKQNIRAADPASLDALRLECARILLDASRDAGIPLPLSPPETVECILESFAFVLYPDAPEALDGLQACGLRLGVIGNWDYRLPGVLEELGIARFFEVILPSAAAGAAKPDRRIFEIALLSLDVLPAHALFIGDSPENDYEGARAAGMASLLLVREGAPPEGVSAIRSLDEIARFL